MKEVYAEIILGTYEEFLLGYKYLPGGDEVKQTFAMHSHSSSIRCLNISGNYLASGSADDRVIVYDLKQRKEHCILTHHNGTVNCLSFTPEHTHLITGSADGVLAIIRVGNWQIEKIWEKAHKGSAILDIAVHKTGKLALTLGADHSLCTWNLIKGRQAYTINLNSKSKDPKNLEHIIWAPCGVRFILFGGKFTEIWSIEKGGLLSAMEHSSKVICCTFTSNNLLLVGYENGKLALLNIDTEKIKIYDGHNNRIKSIGVYDGIFITASSNGQVFFWNNDFEKLAEISTDCRITCLDVTTLIEEKDCIVKYEIKEKHNLESSTKMSNRKKNSRVEVIQESDSEAEAKVVPKKKVKRKKK